MSLHAETLKLKIIFKKSKSNKEIDNKLHLFMIIQYSINMNI